MNIEEICHIIDLGGLVITPTDTVYGIMGDALNEDTIKKVYEVKRRPFSKPLILLMSSYEMVLEYTTDLNDKELELLKSFLGVTIILKKNDRISNLITADSDFVGIRIPDNKELLEVIEKLGRPVISTSANISDEDVITNVSMLDEKLKEEIDYIYDGGDVYSESSTIVKFDGDELVIIREQ